MSFHSHCVAALAFLSLVQTFGKLIVVRHPPDEKGTTRNLTCMADDDNAALVWNFIFDTNEPDKFIGSTDFEPRITTWKENPGCAIWNSTGCSANWEGKGEWNKVNSADEPMGPAFDFRWEGFNELTFTKSDYQLVGRVKNRTGSVVFSVRAMQEIHIFMCKGQDRKKGPCLWISISGRKNDYSAIRFCDSGIPHNWKLSRNTECRLVEETQVEDRLGLGPHAWSTFTVTWDVDKGIIKVFKYPGSEPFLEGDAIVYPGPKSTIWMSNDKNARVRLHFYDYWTTRRRNVILSTKKFQTDHEHVHLQFLLGLCPKCLLIVNLVDKSRRSIMNSSRTFLGNSKSMTSGLLKWQPAELKFKVQYVDRDNLRLEIRTVLDDNNAVGHWAIGYLRVKNSVDGVRKSTITISKPTGSTNWPSVPCERLSPGTVDEISNLLPHLYELIESCNSVCNHTKPWSVCDRLSCTSEPGFTLKNCINGKPRFEIVPGCKHVTVKLCSASSSLSQHRVNHHTLRITEPTGADKSPILSNFSSIPHESPLLAPDTSYDVELFDDRGDWVISTRIRTLRLVEVSTAPPKNRSTSVVPPCVSSTAEPPQMTEGPKIPHLAQGPKIPYLALLLIPLVIITCLLLFICIRKRRKASPQGTEVPMTDFGYANVGDPPEEYTDIRSPIALGSLGSIQKPSPDVVPARDTHSYPVKVKDFEKYTKDGLASGLLDSQYTTFAAGPAKPSEFGKIRENVTKNRYQDQIPYDDTRVILEEINDDPSSDYMNASYIRGYSKSKAYIATQGPKPKTVKDFWRMIWQEKVSVICMLANVVEGGKKKCEQYWPEIGTRTKHGDILISNINHQVFADYTFRTLSIRSGKETREVMHLHYTGWPDHGVPMYTQSLVLYLKKLLATSAGAGPTVVHCSAGVGRTGTIILCAICLRRAVAERVIDVPAVLERMREDRANMVNNAQQYLLAHLAMVESMTIQQTQIPCDDLLPVKIKELKKQLPSDIKRLKDTVWQDQVLHSLAEARKQKQKNSTDGPAEALPGDSESETNRINAVSVDGARLKRQFLASRLPSSSTVSDFWSLIAEKRIELVVVLQRPDPKDRKSCDILPSEGVTGLLSPSLRVEIKKEPEKREHYTIDKLVLTETLEGESMSQPVTVLTCTGWGRGKNGKPPSADRLVSLWMASEKVSRQEGQTLVLCQNGVTGCGLYLALNFLLERMTVDGECDVISAVRAVRRSDTEFVQSSGQFERLYEVAIAYHELFKTYANFS